MESDCERRSKKVKAKMDRLEDYMVDILLT